MITDGTGKWHYLAIKRIPALLRGITSTHNDDFYCLNCFHSYRTHDKLKNMSKYLKITIFAFSNYQMMIINIYQVHQLKIP